MIVGSIPGYLNTADEGSCESGQYQPFGELPG